MTTSRKSKFNTFFYPKFESELTARFEKLLTASEDNDLLFTRREVGVGKNIADLVAFNISSKKQSFYSLSLSAFESVILSLLRQQDSIAIEEIRTSFSTNDLLPKLKKLIDSSLLKIEDGRLSLAEQFPATKIIAYESKLKDWKSAILQAENYFSYADEAYVVLPESILLSSNVDLSLFEEKGVGLIFVTESEYQIIIKSSQSKVYNWQREFVYSRILV